MIFSCCDREGCLTGVSRPAFSFSHASVQEGNVSLSKCATAASSHQPASFGMADLCAPELRYARMAASFSHPVIVQNARRRSTRMYPPTKPVDLRACEVDDWLRQKNSGSTH